MKLKARTSAADPYSEKAITPLAVYYPKKPKKRERRQDTKLINVTHVKNLALNFSRDLRAGKFTEISRQFLIDCNSFLHNHIRQKVQSAPSKGKTLQ